jgi:hypothetical protein
VIASALAVAATASIHDTRNGKLFELNIVLNLWAASRGAPRQEEIRRFAASVATSRRNPRE